MHTKPNKRGGDRESTRKRIQNNDSKDDPSAFDLGYCIMHYTLTLFLFLLGPC